MMTVELLQGLNLQPLGYQPRYVTIHLTMAFHKVPDAWNDFWLTVTFDLLQYKMKRQNTGIMKVLSLLCSRAQV